MASTKTVRCASWDDFISQIAQLRAVGTNSRYLFRGHASSAWKLRSGLGRIAQAAHMDDLAAVGVERQLLESFVRHAHLLLPPSMLAEESDLVHWWAVMQHYRAPTRLLDWTWSPFVALYFASVDEPDNQGAVWAVSKRKLNQLTPEHHHLLNTNAQEFFWKTRVSVLFAVVDSKRPSERMNVQQGVFTVTNAIVAEHEQFISHLEGQPDANDLVKIEVQADCKTEMLERLREMNVNGLSLFPGIDGVGKMMRELASILARNGWIQNAAT